VECIGKGKAHKPYEFGGKVTVATTNARSPRGQFAGHNFRLLLRWLRFPFCPDSGMDDDADP